MGIPGVVRTFAESERQSLSAGGGFARDAVLTSLAAFTTQTLTPETLHRVAGARVMLANYELLLHDFPAHIERLLGRRVASERDLGDADTQAIDDWLAAQTAFVSTPQSSQAYANTTIALTGETRLAHRPPRYFGAAVMTAANGGLFDVKGCGVPAGTMPSLPNSNGLLTIGEAIFEFAMERLVFAALRHAGSAARPIPAYGVIDLGFDVKEPNPNGAGRATLLLRRAQTRPEFQWGHADPGPVMAGLLMGIELTLRRYGISASSCGAVRFRIADDQGALAVTRDDTVLPFDQARLEQIRQATRFAGSPLIVDGVNVQIADGDAPRVLDFGRYRLRSAFDAILYTWWTRDYESLVGEFLLPDSARYVQPDPHFSMAGAETQPEWRALWRAVAQYQNDNLGRRALTHAFNAAIEAATARVAGAL